jgi:FkbM family methyltransferase
MLKLLQKLSNSLNPFYRNGIGNRFARKNLNNVAKLESGTQASVSILDKPFTYHNNEAFYITYKEIFERKMYAFNTKHAEPIILDCGANMGLSVLYFALYYPKAKIIAFEPEKHIFDVLQRNVASFNLDNVTLKEKAVWINEDDLKFYTDAGMGGSVTNVYTNQEPKIIKTEVLANYLNQPIALLKMDIEGAELPVIKHCASLLGNVENIFIEYHSFINQPQQLEELLVILKQNGFRYHLSESFSYRQPFIENTLVCENMDLAINIFGYRNK